MSKNLNAQAIRKNLGQQVKTLLKRIRDHEERLRAGAGTNPDPFDLAQAQISRHRSLTLLAQTRQQLEQVEAALQRLDEGTYGKCTNCGKEIDAARLEALPYAVLCINCQEQQEQVA